MKYKRKLQETEQRLRAIQHALPALPTPKKLCDRIIDYCWEFRDCINSVAAIENRNTAKTSKHGYNEHERTGGNMPQA
nr:unnamed protein product [Haemonchus contortus]